MKPSTALRLALVGAGAVALIWAAQRLDLSAYLAPERIGELLGSAGVLAPLVLIGLMATAVVVSPIPSLPLDIAAGAFFGPWLGTLYAALGASLGAMISFGIARLLGRELIERFLGGHISFCTECSDHLLTRIVLVSRLVPFLSFDLISYGAGLTKMSLRRFSLATFVGVLPLTFLYAYSGPFLVSGGRLTVVLGLAMVLLLLALPPLIERYDPFGIMRRFRHE